MRGSTLRRSVAAHERDVKLREEASPRQRTSAARSVFMERVGKVGRVNDRRCQHTLPLFPLWLILDADGTLSRDVAGLVEGTQA